MRSHRFINSLLYLVIQLVAKESKAKENVGIGCFFLLFLDKRYISQDIHFKAGFTYIICFHSLLFFFL